MYALLLSLTHDESKADEGDRHVPLDEVPSPIAHNETEASSVLRYGMPYHRPQPLRSCLPCIGEIYLVMFAPLREVQMISLMRGIRIHRFNSCRFIVKRADVHALDGGSFGKRPILHS